MKRRIAVVGLSVRGVYTYVLPLLGDPDGRVVDLSDHAEFVGLLEPDAERAEAFFNDVGVRVPCYNPGEIDKLVAETRPDTIVVTGPDWSHADAITASLATGTNVISEKPVVITSEQVRSVLSAARDSGKHLGVAHNYRYAPPLKCVKSLLMDGRIGRVTNIEFVYNLDTHHGSSYFFRWNRERGKSGGLNIHKCCHHFDIVNWLLGDHPESVSAFGKLNYYGANGALRPRNPDGSEMPLAETKANCPVFKTNYSTNFSPDDVSIGTSWDKRNLPYNLQYPASEPRYIYDAEIDIEDTYGVIMQYRKGTILTYSCNFATPWEGFTLGINGTKGRIELSQHSNPDPTGKAPTAEAGANVIVLPLFGGKEIIEVPPEAGGHGGADPHMLRDLFIGQSEESKQLGLMATAYDGGVAVCQGEAVFKSLASGKVIAIRDLLGDHYQA